MNAVPLLLQFEMTPVNIGWIATGSLLFGILGFFLAGTKGNGCWGCILGLLLGPLGLLIAILIPGRR